MSLAEWERNGWLQVHKTSRQEIRDLLAIADRDLHDAREHGISPDWRFGIAYNAALKLCTVLLHAEGFRTVQTSAHYRTLASLPLIIGESRKQDAEYLETCRRKRNIVEYDRVGGATDSEADELIQFGTDLRDDAKKWLGEKHPDLL